MKTIKLIRLFISCPGDIKDELDSIRLIVDDINKTFGRQNSYIIQCLNWSDDTYSDKGTDAQDVINQQIDPHYDILIGIIWQKIGSPTLRANSGTIEEINRAVENSEKRFLIYFKTAPPSSLNDIDLVEFSKVREFKKELSDKGVLYKEFDSITSFESRFRVNISNLISDKLLNKDDQVLLPDKADRYADINSILSEVETNNRNDEEIDVFVLTETSVATFNSITESLNRMTNMVLEIGDKMSIRTAEILKISNIKDNRLRFSKSHIIMDLHAAELSDFTKKMEAEKEILASHFLNIAPQYSQLLSIEKLYPQNDVNLRDTFVAYRDSVRDSAAQTASFLKSISSWPLGTSKFNQSKRETELVLKELTKLFLEGLILMDEVLDEYPE